jgi:hypothetical protein
MAPRPTTHDRAATRTADGSPRAARPARPVSRRWRGLAAAGAVALLAACASGSGSAGDAESPTTGPATQSPTPVVALVAGSSVVGLPDGLASPPVDAVAGAARTEDDTLLYVVTYGSGSCPGVADATTTDPGDGTVAVTFPEPGDGPCTMDWVPATTVVALPDGVASDGELTVQIGDLGQVTLPAGSDEPAWVQSEG